MHAHMHINVIYEPVLICISILLYKYLDILDPGYSICWDNVQKLSISRHHLRQENKMMLWALCFAAKNRISFRHLDRLDDKCSVRDIEMHVSFICIFITFIYK